MVNVYFILNDKPWFNEFCLQVCREKQTAYRLWTQNKSDLCWNNYKLTQAHANSVYDDAMMEYRRNYQMQLNLIVGGQR